MSQRSRILDWFDQATPDQEVVSFDELLGAAFKAVTAADDAEAELFVAEKNARRYWGHWLTRYELHRERGLTPLFEVISDTSRSLRWRPATALGGPRQLKFELQRINARPALVDWLRTIDDRGYEKAGAAVFTLAGASDVTLTQKGGDAGVDVYAAVPAYSPCHLLGGRGQSAMTRVVVQSKKYSSAVGPEKMREFCFVLDAIRHRAPAVTSVPDWFRTKRSPIVGVFFGHSGFSSGARDLAADHGVVLASSLDLAEMAAASRRLDPHGTVVQRLGAFETLTTTFS